MSSEFNPESSSSDLKFTQLRAGLQTIQKEIAVSSRASDSIVGAMRPDDPDRIAMASEADGLKWCHDKIAALLAATEETP